MTPDMVIDGLAVVGAGTCLYWAIRGLTAFLGWVERSEIERQRREAEGTPPAAARRNAPAATVDAGIPGDHLAVIAAVAALGGGRVVFVHDSAAGQTWTSEGRWLHQTSHHVR